LLSESYNNIGCDDDEEEVDSDDMEYTEDAIDNMILEFSYHFWWDYSTYRGDFGKSWYRYNPTGPVSSNIYRPTINSTGPNLKTALMTINSNHQNSKHDDVPNIMWTCRSDIYI
jgi:hypothetical protein